jgi:hypothetical protein
VRSPKGDYSGSPSPDKFQLRYRGRSMAKKNRPEPFIIVLANLLSPLPQPLSSNLQRIKSTLTDARRQYPHFSNELKKISNELDGRNKYKALMYCDILRDMVFWLANYDDTPTISWLTDLNKILENVSPVVSFNKKGKFVSSGMSKSKSDFISQLSFEIARFLTEDYRPGLVATCGLYECKKYIVTWTGKKYCTKKHAKKYYDQQRLNDEKKALELRINNRLNKQYHRKMKATPALMKKKYPGGFHDYKNANWPKDIAK